ncbi:MAG: hypothetical protein ACI35R_03930 [Bacillus sp. (in: firmicutes)]
MDKQEVTHFEVEAIIQYITYQLDQLEERLTINVQAERDAIIAKQRDSVVQVVSDYRQIEHAYLIQEKERNAAVAAKPILSMEPKYSF